MGNEMAKCPDCQRRWFWDWEMDCYVYENGDDVDTVSMGDLDGDNCLNFEVTIYQCECGAVNSTLVHHLDIGAVPVNIKAWENVDWEAKENDAHYLKEET